MTKANFDRATAIETMTADLRGYIDARRLRDSTFAEGARKRSDKYLAFFATTRFATAAVDYQIDLRDLFNRCDKTLDRFVRVFDALLRDDLSLKNESDQNRYTFGLVRSLIAGAAQKIALQKKDVLATATKRDDAQDFVTVSRRVMSDTTAERQSGIAVYTLELLGVITRTKTESGVMQMTVNTKATAYKRFLKLIASGQ